MGGRGAYLGSCWVVPRHVGDRGLFQLVYSIRVEDLGDGESHRTQITFEMCTILSMYFVTLPDFVLVILWTQDGRCVGSLPHITLVAVALCVHACVCACFQGR